MDLPHLRLAPTAPSTAVTSPVVEAIRVVVADDHELMRHTLSRLLAGEDDLAVIAEAHDLPSLVQRLDEYRPHVLVLDFGMLEGSSIETIRQLRDRAPDTQLVIVTMDENPVFAQRSLAAGALGFVLKELATEELSAAIRCVVTGNQYLSPRLALPLDDPHRTFAEDKLTVREVEVLRQIALGHTSVEIARKLGLSPRTVETHRARIHRKLGLVTRAELVAYALRRGLLRV
jgi:two-component system response regulator NreC